MSAVGRAGDSRHMTTTAQPKAPSWWMLIGISVLVGPALIIGANFAVIAVQDEFWKGTPELPAVSDEPALNPPGVIAYVEAPSDMPAGPTPGCIFVVEASGRSAPRRLGCSGDGVIPPVIERIAWSRSGNLEVYSAPPSPKPVVLQVGAGRRLLGRAAEIQRIYRVRPDGAVVRLADRTEDRQELAVDPPKGPTRVIVSLDGPEGYQFAEPQWSPDGRWILVADTKGRLLITDEHGENLRELLGPSPAREWLEQPLLTWHQGGTR